MHRLAVAVVAALALLALPAGVQADVPPPVSGGPGLTDGVYQGTIAWPGSISFAGPVALQGRWTLHGRLSGVVVEGTTIGGEFSWILNGHSAASDGASSGSGRGTVFGSGTVAGTAQSPCFSGTNHVSAVVTVDGEAFDVEDDYPIECEYTRWQITAATCSYATGEWTGETEAAIESGGGSLSGSGTFVLWRTGELAAPETENATVDGFLTELDQIFQAETIDGARLSRVLHAVAEYEGNQARNLACGQRHPEYTRMVGNFLYRLLDRVLSEDRTIPLRDLRWLAFAALNTGLIGSGSFQPERSAHLDDLFNQHLLVLIAQAERERDATALTQIFIFARQYGWTQRADEAYAAAERIDNPSS